MPARLLPLILPVALAVLAVASRAGAAQAGPAAPTPAELAARPALERRVLDVRFLESKLARQENVLAELAREAARLAREEGSARDAVTAQAERLRQALPGAWRAEVALRGVMEAPLVPWDEADRNLRWLAASFDGLRAGLEDLEKRRAALAGLAARKAVLAPEVLDRAREEQALRDRVLAERLKLMAELSALRRERISGDERLERILSEVDRAGLTPLSALRAPLAILPEDAPAAAAAEEAGEAVSGADGPRPRADAALAGSMAEQSPRPGTIRASMAPGAPVKAAHWGRVAFAGDVPGLGGVVVLAHGNGLASVYSGLGGLVARAGQDVARGEPLGAAGCRPDGPGKDCGMTFELRFGLKPINPSRWLPTG